MAVFKSIFLREQTPLLNTSLAFVLLALGLALSIRGIYKQHGVMLVGGIAFTTLALFFLAKEGHLNLPYGGLAISGYVTIASGFAIVQFLRFRDSKVRVLWCDVTVSYCFIASVYAIYFLYDNLLVLLLVLVGILCPSIFYWLKRKRLNYASVSWGFKV